MEVWLCVKWAWFWPARLLYAWKCPPHWWASNRDLAINIYINLIAYSLAIWWSSFHLNQSSIRCKVVDLVVLFLQFDLKIIIDELANPHIQSLPQYIQTLLDFIETTIDLIVKHCSIDWCNSRWFKSSSECVVVVYNLLIEPAIQVALDQRFIP